MSSHDIYIPNLFEKGLRTISDIIHPNGLVLSLDEIKHQYLVEHINPLHYLRIQQNVKQCIKTYKIDTQFIVQRPFVPLHILPIWKNKKGVNAFYKILTNNYKNTHTMKNKWQVEMQVTIDNASWNNIFKMLYQSVTSNLLVWFQLKLIYRILGTKEYLNKIIIVDSPNCNHCQERETILHMFVQCNRVSDFWKQIEKKCVSINWIEYSIFKTRHNFWISKI